MLLLVNMLSNSIFHARHRTKISETEMTISIAELKHIFTDLSTLGRLEIALKHTLS